MAAKPSDYRDDLQKAIRAIDAARWTAIDASNGCEFSRDTLGQLHAHLIDIERSLDDICDMIGIERT